MEKKGGLRLALVTSSGSFLSERVEVRLSRPGSKPRTLSVEATGPVLIRALSSGIYQLDVVAAGFDPQGRSIRIEPGKPTEVCIVFSAPKGLTPVSVFQVSDTLSEADLTARVRSAIAGAAAGADHQVIIWQDRGDEVAVHLSTLQVRLAAPAVFAAVDMESDQTGRGTLIVRFVFGNDADPAGLFATSDEQVHGHTGLASRWGPIFRELIWSALTRLSSDHAAERGLAPLSLTIAGGALRLAASPSLSLPDRVHQLLNPAGSKP